MGIFLNKSSKWALTHLWIVCFIIVVGIWSFRLISLHYAGFPPVDGGTQYTSDKVAQQNILWDWQHGYHDGALMGDNNWFIKYPLYVVVNNLPLSPLKQVLLTTWVLVGATAFLIIFSLDKLLREVTSNSRRQRNALIAATLFLAAIPKTVFYIIAYPNSRNIELGLFMLLMISLCRLSLDRALFKTHVQLKTILLVFLTGSLVANDPLFLYNVVAPLLLAVGLYYLSHRLGFRKFAYLSGFLLLSVATSLMIRVVLAKLLPLLSIMRRSNFTSYHDFISNINLLVSKGFDIFGLSIWGRNPFAPGTILVFIYIGVLVLSGIGLLLQYIWHKGAIYSGFMLVCSVSIIGIFLFTSYVTSTGDDPLIARYLIFLVPLEIYGLSFMVTFIKSTRQLVTLGIALGMACILVIGQSAVDLATNYKTQPNLVDRAIVAQIEYLGIKKGYAYYNRSVIDSFLSGHALNVVSVSCGQIDHSLYYFPVLNEKALLYQPAKQSFYVFSLDNSGDCTDYQVAAQLGQPDKVITINSKTYIALYNYDIGNRIKR